jgi:hypothetical protein
VIVIKRTVPETSTTSTTSWNWCDEHQGWHLEPPCPQTAAQLAFKARIKDLIERHADVLRRLADA